MNHTVYERSLKIWLQSWKLWICCWCYVNYFINWINSSKNIFHSYSYNGQNLSFGRIKFGINIEFDNSNIFLLNDCVKSMIGQNLLVFQVFTINQSNEPRSKIKTWFLSIASKRAFDLSSVQNVAFLNIQPCIIHMACKNF